jgi:hypothetical protein
MLLSPVTLPNIYGGWLRVTGAVHPLKLFIRVSTDAKSEYGQPDGLLLTSHPSNLKFGNFADILIVIEQYPERCGRRATSEFTYGARRLN